MDRARAEATERRLRELVHGVCDQTAGRVRDTGAAIDCLCRLAVTELGLLGAAVTLMTAAGSRTVLADGAVDHGDAAGNAGEPAVATQAVAGASDEKSHELEHLQFSVGEGPGLQAFATGRPVMVPDLEVAFERWPAYAPSAIRAGLGSVNAFPLQIGAARFGTLTLYDATARHLSADAVMTCLIFAELGTEQLLDSTHPSRPRSLDPGLGTALRVRSEVYQAQGKVAVQLGVSLAHALLLMRARAFADGRDLSDLAIALLDGTAEMGHHVE